MILRVSVESPQLITKRKRDGSGAYRVQEAWAYCYGPNGLHPHPQRIEVFPPQDEQGAVVPYQVGEYALAPDSMSVRYNRIDVFTKLIPMAEAISLVRAFVAKQKAA
jgi:hypothetical protein